MTRRAITRAAAFAAALLIALSGCGSGEDGSAATTSSSAGTTAATLRVPEDHPTIQDAVDAAGPGDLVLIEPGTYPESVVVEVPDLVIRGLDRDAVVLDGAGERENGVFVVADGVAVENLTVRDYRSNGLFFTGDSYGGEEAVLEGYRASYVTAVDNGQYGIYAFGARGGLIEHSAALGHPDSGIYVGQCDPCDVVIDDVLAQGNATGILATNASGGVQVVRSTITGNRVGVALNSQDLEELAPQHDAVLVGNVIRDNANAEAPATADGTFGIGVLVGGGQDDLIERNLVVGHPTAGVLLVALDGYQPSGNEVRANTFDGGPADLVLVSGEEDAGSLRSCFADNMTTQGSISSSPPEIQSLLACPADGASVGPTPPLTVPSAPQAPSDPGPSTVPDLDDMSDAASAPAQPAAARPAPIDLESIDDASD